MSFTTILTNIGTTARSDTLVITLGNSDPTDSLAVP